MSQTPRSRSPSKDQAQCQEQVSIQCSPPTSRAYSPSSTPDESLEDSPPPWCHYICTVAEAKEWTHEELIGNISHRLPQEAVDAIENKKLDGSVLINSDSFAEFIENMSAEAKDQMKRIRKEIWNEAHLRKIDDIIEKTSNKVKEYGFEAFHQPVKELDLLLPMEPWPIAKPSQNKDTCEALKSGSFRYICRNSFQELIAPIEQALEEKSAMKRVVLFGGPGTGKRHTLAALAAYMTAKLHGRVAYIPDLATGGYEAINSALLFACDDRRIQNAVIEYPGREELVGLMHMVGKHIGFPQTDRRVFIIGNFWGSGIRLEMAHFIEALTQHHILVVSEDTYRSWGNYVHTRDEDWVPVEHPSE